MEILQRTNKRFQEGIRVRVVRVETLSTIWVCIEGKPRISEIVTLVMRAQPTAFWPKEKNLRPGMIVAVLAKFTDASFWDRAILLEQTATGYVVLLIDYGIETHRNISSIRLLPQKLAEIAPWARKIRLLGVREQADQTLSHRVAQFTMLRRSGFLKNIDSSPGETMTASLLLDGMQGESPTDMGEYWLQLGYLDPE
jgi:hypothetical protein